MSSSRTCEACRRTMEHGDVRWRDQRTGKLVCSTCLAHPTQQPNKIDVTASRRRVTAHDGGDGQVIRHCFSCGSGGLVGRSDGSTECTVCQTVFTVQVQPMNVNAPQTINGQPVHVPGMPEESAVAPSTAVPAPPEGEGEADPAGDLQPTISDDDEFMTATGQRLDFEHYAQYLALEAPGADRQRVLGMVRQSNLKTGQALPTAYCMRCTEEDLPPSWLCRRPGQVAVIDHGPDHDPDLARYEGICQRCCGHNHG